MRMAFCATPDDAVAATGKVKTAHKKRRRRKEFLDFMDEIVAAYPKQRLEVILDILNTPTQRTKNG